MTDSERAAIRAQAFKEAAEIARAKARSAQRSAHLAMVAGRTGVSSHRQSDAETANDIAAAIEAAAKGQSQ